MEKDKIIKKLEQLKEDALSGMYHSEDIGIGFNKIIEMIQESTPPQEQRQVYWQVWKRGGYKPYWADKFDSKQACEAKIKEVSEKEGHDYSEYLEAKEICHKQRQGLSEEKVKALFTKYGLTRHFNLISEICQLSVEASSPSKDAPTSEEREELERLRERYAKCEKSNEMLNWTIERQSAREKQLEAELANYKRDLKASESVGNQLADHIEHLNKELAELKATPRTVTDEEIENKALDEYRLVSKIVGMEMSEEEAFITGYKRAIYSGRDLLKGGEQWISVEERLPEGVQGVLVRLTDTQMPLVGWYNKRWMVMFSTGTEEPTMKTVTHWMPLPKAPTKGGEGK